MRDNPVWTRWRNHEPVISAWLGIDSSYLAEIVASLDFDAVVVDLQHGMLDIGTAVAMFQAISAHRPAPLARVPANEPGIIMKLLDAGAYGIICPLVNTRADCARFVHACRYAPVGGRSYGPARGFLYGGADYFEHANATVLTLAMIETGEALQNLEGIVSVDGLDAIFIGPNDLSISLGYGPGAEFQEPALEEAIARILAASQSAGRRVGIFCASGENARRRIQQGFDMVIPANDTFHLKSAYGAALAAARG